MGETRVFDIINAEMDKEIAIIESLGVGESRTISFEYAVTAADVAATYVTNWAVANCITDGFSTYCFSNVVVSPTGMDDRPFGVITDLAVIKEEISTPANGAYYQEGETIRYEITYLNCGETEIGETLIYDSLKTDCEIASAEHLAVGEERTCFFNYRVTAADVDAGYVLNTAVAQYMHAGGFSSAISDEVVSPTSGEQIPDAFVAVIETPVLPGDDDCCVPALTERTAEKIVCTQRFCAAHEATRQAIESMTGFAKTSETKTAAWQYARSLWQSDAETMYDALMKAANGPAKAVVLNERILFDVQAANHESVLNARYPDAPERVAEEMALMYMDRCTMLCYALHTAPEDRADNLLGVECTEAAHEANDACGLLRENVNEANVRLDMRLCATHSVTSAFMEALLSGGDTEKTWNRIETMWQREMQMGYQALKSDTTEENYQALAADEHAFELWLEAHRTLLNHLYPEKETVAAQIIAKAVMHRVVELCKKN